MMPSKFLSTVALASVIAATTASANELSAIDAVRALTSPKLTAPVTNAEQADDLVTGTVIQSNGQQRVLYHLPATGENLRLQGETVSRQWTVNVAPGHLRGLVRFQLGYQNAVSVMPEASYLTVEINGNELRHEYIKSSSRSKRVSFEVPSHILAPGRNSVRISARQRHRVDCSLDATHELWTDLDPAQTGFVFDVGNSAISTLDGLPAVARNAAGQVPLRLLVPNQNDRSQVQSAMLLAQHLAIAAGFENSTVEVADVAGDGPGVDIYVGSLAELKTAAPQYASRLTNSPLPQVLSEDGKERVAVIVVTQSMKRSDLAESFERWFPVSGPNQDVDLAAARGSKFQLGEPVELSTLGLNSQEFDGRLYKKSFDVTLPSDYLSADYNQAELRIAFAYKAGLDPENQFLVRVNDQTAAGFPLTNPSGQVFHDKMLRIPLSAFKAGRNTVEFEAQLRKATDADCSPHLQIEGEKRFAISGKSTIEFPTLAYLPQLPNLGGTMEAGYPYVVKGKAQPSVVSIVEPTYSSLGAAATFLNEIALSSGTPLDFDLVYGTPKDENKHVIMIGEYQSLPRSVSTEFAGLDTGEVLRAWSHLHAAPTPVRPVAPAKKVSRKIALDATTTSTVFNSGASNQPGFPASASGVQPAYVQPDVDVLDSWSPQEKSSSSFGSFDYGEGYGFQKLYATLKGWNGPPQQIPTSLELPATGLLLNQRFAPSGNGKVWTVITGSDPRSLQNGMEQLVQPAFANLVTGETSALDPVSNKITSAATGQRYVRADEFSLRNIHLIIAGWLSNNHTIYGLIMIFGLVVTGFISNALLRRVGVRREEAAQ